MVTWPSRRYPEVSFLTDPNTVGMRRSPAPAPQSEPSHPRVSRLVAQSAPSVAFGLRAVNSGHRTSHLTTLLSIAAFVGALSTFFPTAAASGEPWSPETMPDQSN